MAKIEGVGMAAKAIFISLAGVALVGGIMATSAGYKTRNRIAKKSNALAYICGIIAGQYAVMSKMPTVFGPETLFPELPFCAEYRENAESQEDTRP